MGCRCDDMRKCKNDMSRVSNIKGILGGIKGLNGDVSDELNDLSSKSMEAFSTINMGTLKLEEIKLNEDIKEIIPELITRCKEKKEDLERIYRSMKSEDRAYHESKRSKKNK